jgi:hypothetical protein
MWLNMKNALQEGRFSIPDDDGSTVSPIAVR